MPTNRPSQKDYVKTALRLPRDLHAAIHAAADQEDRTYNGEILARLRSTFEPKRASTQQKGQQQ